MKLTTQTLLVAFALAAPVAAFAQNDSPVTRAQVRGELVQLEQAGWHPTAGRDPHYPDDLMAAEARVAKADGQDAYGGVANGTVASGRAIAPALAADPSPLYDHH